ncbi:MULTISPECIES: pseudouridine-5'-phosphate glycosidase [unclassified Paenibacillus]|uniref:pseudouridine-5'-phosphate glycosidase n=1 Tax=unclassified Paenibacillus TaxID=185978 RepID=UPI001C125E3D|nr:MULTISPECIES: pseudouridine-5'-phosphate glycosidase [unclassified Paenibacillus]MBU5444268.1 pseudouridine-5'-phosphate glycosidase [Paenibacillus sp. MSJ-34]CAH0120097.1 Pseudouridine-5'-phosphate glycosidase [Paenibacillus sp. CECT 9249]
MSFLKINEEVQQALAASKPIVALESTIISHGMPYPDNVKMALDVEELIREQGAVPATIAIMDGKICIGLSKEEIERLGTDQNVFKASIRDFPRVLSGNLIGATTVAATAYAANLAGIRFFATGGLGGVHRGVNESYDISADLTLLADCPICIVSSGVKSILDIPKTIEYLETLGVPVYGYETDRYPGFYVRDSGHSVEKIELNELVDLLKVRDEMKFRYAVSVAVPIPEEAELDPQLVETTITEALKEAEQKGISGKPVTPFLLSKIKETTGGKSLDSNIKLMKNNAKTAAKIAVAFHGV